MKIYYEQKVTVFGITFQLILQNKAPVTDEIFYIYMVP